MNVSIEEQIAEVKRELGMRARVYPRFVEQKQITAAQAKERIAALEAVMDSLESIRAQTRPELFK